MRKSLVLKGGGQEQGDVIRFEAVNLNKKPRSPAWRISGVAMPESTRQQKYHFDLAEFDHWARLAVVDPDAFEARRSRLVEDFISSVPPERQLRLRRLQWRIDQIRRRARTPLAACIHISRMMWDSVLGDGGLHETLNGVLDGRGPSRSVPAARLNAQVLLFPDRRKSH